jgi:hypothetical protein
MKSIHIFIVSAMTPMQYIQRYIYISSGRRQLYNSVFNRHKEAEDDETERRIRGQVYKHYFCSYSSYIPHTTTSQFKNINMKNVV